MKKERKNIYTYIYNVCLLLVGYSLEDGHELLELVEGGIEEAAALWVKCHLVEVLRGEGQVWVWLLGLSPEAQQQVAQLHTAVTGRVAQAADTWRVARRGKNISYTV